MNKVTFVITIIFEILAKPLARLFGLTGTAGYAIKKLVISLFWLVIFVFPITYLNKYVIQMLQLDINIKV